MSGYGGLGDSGTGGTNGHRPAEQPPLRARLLPLAEVKPEPIRWLWPARIPARKLAMLDGDPSVGKSTIALDWAARISTGSPWPDGQPCERGAVVILSAEDDPADTIRPRLEAAGGDPAMVHMLTKIRAVDEDDQGNSKVIERPPTLADVEAIREAITTTGAVLLIVDVLMAYLPGRVDSHRDQDVRAVLARLAELAAETGCTVLALRHLNKSRGGGVALYAGGGSIGIVGGARAAYVAARDPDDPTRRVLAVVKLNLGPEPPSLAYRLVPVEGTDVARVEWLGTSEHDAAGLLAVGSDEDRADRDEAAEWLIEYLTEHGREGIAGEVIAAANKAGLAKHTVQRARKRAGITSRKGSLGGGWVWALPPEGDTEGDEGDSSQNLPPSSPWLSPSDAEGSTKGAKGAASGEPRSSLPSALPSHAGKSAEGARCPATDGQQATLDGNDPAEPVAALPAHVPGNGQHPDEEDE